MFAPPFTPTVRYGENVILGDDELAWTERFVTGVFCFHEGELGISLKCANKGLFELADDGWALPIHRKYCDASPNVHEKVRDITCLIPASPGVFLPLQVDDEQKIIMDHLLGLADVVERLLDAESSDQDDDRTEELRNQLNQLYDSFVLEYGLISNCNSYYDGIWHDLRLDIYLTQLVNDVGYKSDIFRRRLNRPRQEQSGQLFFQEDINERIAQAFAWCMGWHGYVDVAEIAEKSGLDLSAAMTSMSDQGLVYREWLGLQKTWWDLLGVDETISSSFALKQAYRQKSKEYHPDINKMPGAEKIMKLINEAFEKGKVAVAQREVRIVLEESTYKVSSVYQYLIDKISAATEKDLPKYANGLFVNVLHGKLLGIWEIPKDLKVGKAKPNESHILVDLHELKSGVVRAIAVFRSQSSAMDTLQELENSYPLMWLETKGFADVLKVIKFYGGR